MHVCAQSHAGIIPGEDVGKQFQEETRSGKRPEMPRQLPNDSPARVRKPNVQVSKTDPPLLVDASQE